MEIKILKYSTLVIALLYGVLSCQNSNTLSPDSLALMEARKIISGGHQLAALSGGVYPNLESYSDAQIDHFISHYTSIRRPFMKQALERRRAYLRLMTSIFKDYGLPEDLISVALVESGFKPKAESSHGALGLWQFMKPTAKAFGLKVGFFVDERTHVIKSTEAAARYLTYLYRQFKDWPLALAAYNSGPGAIRRAIKKADVDNFFDLAASGSLSKETTEFVPKVLAAAIISRNPSQYGFSTF